MNLFGAAGEPVTHTRTERLGEEAVGEFVGVVGDFNPYFVNREEARRAALTQLAIPPALLVLRLEAFAREIFGVRTALGDLDARIGPPAFFDEEVRFTLTVEEMSPSGLRLGLRAEGPRGILLDGHARAELQGGVAT